MTKLEARVRNYVSTHKKTLVVAASAITLIVVQHKGIQNLNAFLEEKDLFDEYYLPSTEEE